MDTHDFVSSLFVIDHSGKGEPLKQIIELIEHTVGIIDVLRESLGTFLPKSKISINISVFVISSEEENLTWIFQLKSQK